MGPGRYFYAMTLMFLILLGGAVFATMTADVTIAILFDREPGIGKGWSPVFMALGLASLITSFVAAVKD